MKPKLIAIVVRLYFEAHKYNLVEIYFDQPARNLCLQFDNNVTLSSLSEVINSFRGLGEI